MSEIRHRVRRAGGLRSSYHPIHRSKEPLKAERQMGIAEEEESGEKGEKGRRVEERGG